MTLSAKRAALLALICLGVELGSARNLPAQSNSPRGPVVVELYTSQGCSSCPPADALLGELSQMPNVLAIAFHVDYWDSIGSIISPYRRRSGVSSSTLRHWACRRHLRLKWSSTGVAAL